MRLKWNIDEYSGQDCSFLPFGFLLCLMGTRGKRAAIPFLTRGVILLKALFFLMAPKTGTNETAG